MPHNLYLHSSLVNARAIDRTNPYVVKETLMYYNLESGLSLFCSFFINLCVISTFAVFNGTNRDVNLLNAGDALSDVFGSKGKYIWAIGLLAAG